MSRRSLHICLVIGFVCLILPALALAQSRPAGQSPDNSGRKVKPEPNDAFRKWLDEVDPIITKAERDAYVKLKNNQEREQFIEHFWEVRDTDPDTVENEYKDEYYERMAYANEHFSSGRMLQVVLIGRHLPFNYAVP